MVYAQTRICPRQRDAQTHLARRQDLVIVNKKRRKGRCLIVYFLVPTDPRIKLKESELKKIFVDNESDGNTNCDWCSWYIYQKTDTRTGGLGNGRTSGDHLNYCIVEISQNTEKIPGDLRRLAVTQTSVR